MKLKKIIVLFILLFISITLLGCSTKRDISNDKKPNDTVKNNTNILIVYFSRTGENYGVGNIEVGNTAIMAGYIKDHIECDVYEIIPVNAYPSVYDECTALAKIEQNEDSRPEINNLISSIDKYNYIFLGYPIWYGSYPQIILTFLDNFDFNGKTIYPFVTHAGSGLSSTPSKLNSYLKNVTIGNGLAISGTDIRNVSSIEKVNKWIDSLNIK